MNTTKIFQNSGNVKIQIQNKKRKNHFNGDWSDSQTDIPIDLVQQGYSKFLQPQSMFGLNLGDSGWLKQQLKRCTFKLLDQKNIKGFLDESQLEDNQVTFLEPSPVSNQLSLLQKQGKQFKDNRFPPEKVSIDGIDQINNAWISKKSNLPWKKLTQQFSNAQIFHKKVDPLSLVQGALGDCYLIAAMSALSQVPQRIMKLFITKQIPKTKHFTVKILYKGKWMLIDVDQSVPFQMNKNKPAFACTSTPGQLWASILQKAWAKLYKSYRRISGGFASQPLHCLTGAPIKQIVSSDDEKIQTQNWQYLVKASKKKYAMVANSRAIVAQQKPGVIQHQVGRFQQKTQIGISKGHAYTFLNATVINYAGKQQKLVQLRNPWGKGAYSTGQYSGPWNDNDQIWNMTSTSQKQRVRYRKDIDDGIFFMPYRKFMQYFSKITVAQINDNASYIYKTLRDKNMTGVYYKIDVLKSGYYSFQCDNTPRRFYAQFGIQGIKATKYSHPNITISLTKITGKTKNQLAQVKQTDQTIYLGHKLQPGTYIVYVKIQFNKAIEIDYDINLSIYSQYVCSIDIASRDLVVIATGNSSVCWNPKDYLSNNDTWNDMGNQEFNGGHGKYINPNDFKEKQDSGWGDYFQSDQYKKAHNSEWQKHNPDKLKNNTKNDNNNGWGDQQFKKKTQQLDDWGRPKKDTSLQNNGWGQQQSNNKNKNNNGWGDTNNNGWGDTTNNNGWGNNNKKGQANNNKKVQGNTTNNNGWGDTTNNNGWGDINDKGQANNKKKVQGNTNNNGWGDTTNNNGWGNNIKKGQANNNKKVQGNTNNNGWGDTNNNNGWF